MSEWQPIETAPRDGTWILATRKGEEFFKCRWMTAYTLAEEYGGSACDYIQACWDDGDIQTCWDDGDNEATPTHWMPLPDPPEVE